MRSQEWRKSELVTTVSSWVNLQLPPDSFSVHQKEEVARLGTETIGGGSAEYGYIEPNLALVRELKANTEMILEMLKLLKVGEQENTVLADLGTMKKNFDELDRLVRLELNSEAFTGDDYKFIGNFVTLFSVKELGARSLDITSPFAKLKMQERLEGIKLKIVVYYKDGKRYFAVGPIFNYWESKK
jgi:hypothetical protein